MTAFVSVQAELHRLKSASREQVAIAEGSVCAIFLEGTGSLTERGGTYLVKPALIAVRRAPHRVTIEAGPSRLRFLTLRFSEDALRELGPLRMGVSQSRTLGGRSSVELAWRIASEIGRPDRLTTHAIDVLATAIALSLSRYVMYGRTRVPPLVARARKLLDQRLTSTRGVSQLARSLGVSGAHLSRTFRAGSGLSPTAYVHWRRVARARSLLLGTVQPVERIAHALGYHDSSHFARQFRRWTGMAPGDFRRQHTSNDQ